MISLDVSVLVRGVNGPKLVVSGETKDKAVASLRRFVRAVEKTDVAVSILTDNGDTLTLEPDKSAVWALIWEIRFCNRGLVGSAREVERWSLPLQAVNEFCSLVYETGRWEDSVITES